MLAKENTSSSPKFPQVVVDLSGSDGNAFAILGAVQKGMRRAGIEKADIDAFFAEAQSGDYDHLLQTAMRTVNVQ
jgi:hypothetical protein